MATKNTPTANRAARQIRGLMAEQRKKGRELAHLLGISQQSASRRMNGETPFNVDELEKIARWLNVSIGRLISAPIPIDT